MNIQEKDILKFLTQNIFINQRTLSEDVGYSLETISHVLKNLKRDGYINENVKLTDKSKQLVELNKPKNAIRLAAGYGLRMTPINREIPKGLLEIKGEIIIERIIKQLYEVEIYEIYIVVGFMKEKYEYLIDKYGVKLIVNTDYAIKNNLYSLKLASRFLSNSYIIPCDIWCNANPFSKYEFYSWYMIGNWLDKESKIYVNHKKELKLTKNLDKGNAMLGICYLNDQYARKVKKRLNNMCLDPKYNCSFWEETIFFKKSNFAIYAKMMKRNEVAEINTYEQLRDFDENSNQLKNDAIFTIEKVFNVTNKEINNISILKKGMTNRSFLFECDSKKYIMRVPGEGTDELINRNQEAEVYEAIENIGICDELIFIDPNNGYKITRFIDNARTCDSNCILDLKLCMNKLKSLHDRKLKVNHYFDLFEKIEYYQSLWDGNDSIFRDYIHTKKNVFALKKFVDSLDKEICLTHIDAVPDNFLIYKESGEIKVRLIDWEYAAMQDPHVDIAMFCIYALYNREQVDQLIDIYFEHQCNKITRLKIYSYISICGLLWSNWCEYKRNLGVEFGEYSLRQYRYAKDYYKIVQEVLKNASR